MKRAGFWLSVGALGLVMTIAGNSEAAMMSYQFSGVVTSFWSSEPMLDDSVHVGTAFSGEVVFDSTASDEYPLTPARSRYQGPSFAVVCHVGTYTWSTGAGNAAISVWNDSFGRDALVFGALTAFQVSPELRIATIGGGLTDNTGRAFSSDAIPVAPVSLTGFDGRGFDIEGFEPATGASFKLHGDITGFTVVPEPSLTLLVLAFVSLGWRKA